MSTTVILCLILGSVSLVVAVSTIYSEKLIEWVKKL